MPESDSPVPVDSLSDPESLLDHPDLAVETTTEPIDAVDFDAAEAWTDHVVVGVADDRGVLLYDDGHHGWTPPAFEVPDDEDALAVARREFEALTGTTLSIEGVLHARCRTFTVADEADDRETAVWNVILQATPDARLPGDPESRVEDAALAWRDGAPEDAPEAVAADVERIASTTPTGDDPTESLTDPAALRDRDGVEHVTVSDDDHFESNRDNEGVAVVGVRDADGELALPTLEAGTVLTHAIVEAGEDFADTAREGAHELLGVDVGLEGVERVRRKVSTNDGEEAIAYDVVFAASLVDDAELPDETPSCQVESTGWYDALPENFAHGDDEMCADARLFVDGRSTD
jgi:hypothetical protein